MGLRFEETLFCLFLVECAHGIAFCVKGLAWWEMDGLYVRVEAWSQPCYLNTYVRPACCTLSVQMHPLQCTLFVSLEGGK